MSDRFDELIADIDGDLTNSCPHCDSRQYLDEPELEVGLCRLGPNWIQCGECGYLFIRNVDD